MEVADLRRFRSYRNWILAHGRTELYMNLSTMCYGADAAIAMIEKYMRLKEEWRND